jgi:hypothetical protein
MRLSECKVGLNLFKCYHGRPRHRDLPTVTRVPTSVSTFYKKPLSCKYASNRHHVGPNHVGKQKVQSQSEVVEAPRLWAVGLWAVGCLHTPHKLR